MLERCLKHMRIDEDGEHTQGFVLFDEAHAAHICRKGIDFGRATNRDLAILFQVEIKRKIVDVIEALVPLVKWLHVDCADCGATSSTQVRDKSTANKTACTGYDNDAIRRELQSAIIVDV